jgi:hypothetical protein
LQLLQSNLYPSFISPYSFACRDRHRSVNEIEETYLPQLAQEPEQNTHGQLQVPIFQDPGVTYS